MIAAFIGAILAAVAGAGVGYLFAQWQREQDDKNRRS